LTLSRHLRLINCPFQARIEQATATMSDTALDPTISDDEVNDLATPGENEEVEAPRDTVEENGLDDDEDDLFGDGDDADEPA
jgi:RNA polymerase-associated protein LEO1